MLTQKIQQDQTSALKQKQQQKLDCLRFLSAQIKNKEIDNTKELTDEDVIVVIRKLIKELKEANVLFEKGERKDLITQNQFQIDLLTSYLPVEMSDQDLKKEIEKIIKDNQELYDKNPKVIIGIAIKALKNKTTSDRIINILNAI